MHIVHVEDFFHPDAGYQTNILCKYMALAGHQVTIVTSEVDKTPPEFMSFFGATNINERDRIYSEETGTRILRLPSLGVLSGRAVFKGSIVKKVESLHPDVIFVHGNDTLTGIRFLLRYKNHPFPIVLDSHMLEMASVNPLSWMFHLFYKRFVAPIIIDNRITVIRTQDDDYVQKCLGIPLAQCPWISVGTDTLLFHPQSEIREQFRRQHNISQDAFVVVYTGKLTDSKGGLLLAEAFKEKFNTKKEVVLLVVGESAQGEYGHQVETLFQKSFNKVIRFPTQRYRDLPPFYQAADLSIFPKQCSLSFYDAQACALPVLAEDNKVNVKRLQYSNGACFFSNDPDDIRNHVVSYCELSPLEFANIGQNALHTIQAAYDYQQLVVRYLNEIQEQLNQYGK